MNLYFKQFQKEMTPLEMQNKAEQLRNDIDYLEHYGRELTYFMNMVEDLHGPQTNFSDWKLFRERRIFNHIKLNRKRKDLISHLTFIKSKVGFQSLLFKALDDEIDVLHNDLNQKEI